MRLSAVLLFLQLWLHVDLTLSQENVGCSPPTVEEGVIVSGLPDNNGSIFYDHLLKFSCEGPGKYLNGSSELVCGTDGEWSGSFPHCEDVTCTAETIPRHLNVTGLPAANETMKYGHKLKFQCADRYSLDGVKEVECLETGKWNAQFPVCTVCLKPPDIPHASVSEESRKRGYEQGDLLYYTCDTGYVSGPTITYICSSKSWKPVRAGECSLKPCELPDDTPNGYYQIIQGDDFVFGTTIKYFCNSGYQMVSKVQTRTCLLNKWTNHVPICEPVSCSPPTVQEGLIVRGLPDNDGPILSDRFITFSCADRSKYLSGSSELICGQDGEWSGTFPSCEDITCQAQKPLPPLYVTGLPPANEKMKYGHKLRFLCDSRYTLFGVTEVECLETGQWSTAFPTCRATCVDPRDQRSLVDKGYRIKVTCRQGLIPQGSPEIECLGNGQWSGPYRCKVPANCGQPPAIENGDIWSSTFLRYSWDHGSTIEYRCHRNYIPLGQSHKTCNNGNWIGEIRCSKPVGCGMPPPLEFGDVQSSLQSSYDHGERVEYSCQSYYTLDGQTHKTCSNGQWTGEMRCIRPCTVTQDDMRRKNIELRYKSDPKIYSRHRDFVTFSCTRGRHDGRLAMRQQCIDGEMLLPSCQ